MAQHDVQEMVKTGQEQLANEAKRVFIQAFMTDVTSKKAIVFNE